MKQLDISAKIRRCMRSFNGEMGFSPRQPLPPPNNVSFDHTESIRNLYRWILQSESPTRYRRQVANDTARHFAIKTTINKKKIVFQIKLGFVFLDDWFSTYLQYVAFKKQRICKINYSCHRLAYSTHFSYLTPVLFVFKICVLDQHQICVNWSYFNAYFDTKAGIRVFALQTSCAQLIFILIKIRPIN